MYFYVNADEALSAYTNEHLSYVCYKYSGFVNANFSVFACVCVSLPEQTGFPDDSQTPLAGIRICWCFR